MLKTEFLDDPMIPSPWCGQLYNSLHLSISEPDLTR